MRLSLHEVAHRAACLSLASWLAACDNWPVQHDDGGAGDMPEPIPRDAGSDCLSVSPVEPSTSTQVNGALCFGIAHGNSQALQCAVRAGPNEVACVDGLLGDAFVVRWTGDRASVFVGLANTQIGSIALVAPNTFQVATSTQVEGQCTMQPGPPPRADFCRFR